MLDKKTNGPFNANNGLFRSHLKMKQGFYNYKYVIKKENGDIDLNKVPENFPFYPKTS